MRIVLGLTGLLLAGVGCGSGTQAVDGRKAAGAGPGGTTLDGPYAHDNMAVYVVHGKTTDTRDYVTLDEGLSSKTVVVREKGGGLGNDQAQVNKLEIENKSDRWLFLQAGDVVKGGKQDRTIGIDIAVAPRSAPRDVDSYCVERGRWAAGAAGVDFDAFTGQVAGNSLKMAVQGAGDQGRVWEEVAKQERKAALVSKVGAPGAGENTGQRREDVDAPVAAMPAQLETGGVTVMALSTTGTYNAIVENKTIQAGREAYMKILLPKLEASGDAVGLVVIINGKIVAADVYASVTLFKKLARKLLDSYALDAVLSRDPKAKETFPVPDAEAVKSFLADAERAEAKTEKVAESMHRRTRDSAKAMLFEYQDANGQGEAAAAPLHRNILGK
jgi:hypothetical protein